MLLANKEHRGPHRGFGQVDVASLKVFMEVVIKLPLLSRGQGEHSGVREFSSRHEVNRIIPCFPWRELVKGFLGEDVSEVVILSWHHILERLAFFNFLGLLG